jgi:hypothetical protein
VPIPSTDAVVQLGPNLAHSKAGERVMEQVIFSTALVVAIWCGGKLFMLARRDR